MKDRGVAELGQVFLHFGYELVSRVAGLKGNVLHKTQSSDPVFPGIIGRCEAITDGLRQSDPFYAFHRGCGAEKVECPHQKRAQPGANKVEGQRKALARRQMKSGGVQEYDLFDGLRMPMGIRHSDDTAPIVYDEVDV